MLRSAPNPYVIVSPEEVDQHSAGKELTQIPIVTTFEMRPDPAIDDLRRRGAAARKLDYARRLDLGLYGVSPAAERR